jgi:hypothetical protein
VSLLERGPKGRVFVSVLFLEVRDLAGQRLDDRVVAAGVFRRGRFRVGLAAEPFDPPGRDRRSLRGAKWTFSLGWMLSQVRGCLAGRMPLRQV